MKIIYKIKLIILFKYLNYLNNKYIKYMDYCKLYFKSGDNILLKFAEFKQLQYKDKIYKVVDQIEYLKQNLKSPIIHNIEIID